MGGLPFQKFWKLVCLFVLLKEFTALVLNKYRSIAATINLKETAQSA